MTFANQLRRFFSVFLVTAVLLASTSISSLDNQAFAAPRTSNAISNVKGESKDINGSYHRLQDATQDSWDNFKDEQQLFSGNKSTRRTTQPKQAIKSINKNAKNALQRTANAVKSGFSSK